jgi:lysophospholipase L1-like esterase
MNYLALGDSISIDDYTGVAHGGAVSQFARLIGADCVADLTRDGGTTDGVLESLRSVQFRPGVVTLTAGGNDLLMAVSWGLDPPRSEISICKPLKNLTEISGILYAYACPVIVNTIYDPTDGDDALVTGLGLPPSLRLALYELNAGIGQIAKSNGFLLSDLHALFAGHSVRSADPWIVADIEPNHAGATAIARHWHDLLRQAPPRA